MGEHTVVDSDGNPLHHAHLYGERDPFFIPATYHQRHGRWKAFSITTQTTTVLTQPANAGLLVVTGITVAAKKVNNGNIQIRFSDGTNNEAFYDALTTNNEINIDFNWADQNVQGWKDAGLEIVTSGANPTLRGMVRYDKIGGALDYEQWVAEQ